MPKDIRVAYFSMEIMLESDIPSYAGGLGILAGDTLRSCADLGVPAIGVSLVYSGYTFSQHIKEDGSQTFLETDWQRMDQLTRLPQKTTIEIDGTQIHIACWRYDIVGLSGFTVPVFMLDTNIPDNPQWVKNLTKNLYTPNPDIRLSQEMILGIGGIRILEELGYKNIDTYHLNEGHTSLVPLGLMYEYHLSEKEAKNKCIFVTHTPVAEGHDKFTYDLAEKLAHTYLPENIKSLATSEKFSLTHLGLNLSRQNLAVSQKHRQVCQSLFPDHEFISITNAVHHRSWIWHIMQDLLDHYLPGWLDNPAKLSQIPTVVPDDALAAAHQGAKHDLIDYVNHHLAQDALAKGGNTLQDDFLTPDLLTISLARRPVAYKRPLLLYSQLDRLAKIGTNKIQIIQCGKSHPSDAMSQEFVREIIRISTQLKKTVRVVYLENYSPKIARLLVSGSDIWLNTPRRPMEACGTSGMKAAMNGVLNFSTLDGWWLEGQDICPEAGFSIGPKQESFTQLDSSLIAATDKEDADDMYTKLESEIIPLFFDHHSDWVKHMKSAMTLGAHFNTHRLVMEYNHLTWEPPSHV